MNSPKKLLIIGAGQEQQAAYETAKAMGLWVVGTDRNSLAPCLRLADESLTLSARDPRGLIHELERTGLGAQLLGVMTIANDVPVTVSAVAAKFGLPAMPISQAELLSDKWKMKRAFQASGVRTPRGRLIHSFADLQKNICSTHYRDDAVLKPIDGRGSRGVLRVNAQSNLVEAYRKVVAVGSPAILEERIEGPQFSTESFFVDGKAYTPGISVRNYDFLERFHPHIIENGGDIRSDYDQGFLERIRLFVQKVGDAIGLGSGPLKCDLILDSRQRLWVIEAAGRLSGGWFASDQIPAATGVDLVKANILFSLGENVDVSSLNPIHSFAVSTRFFFVSPGHIESISGVSLASQIPGVMRIGLYRGVGDYQPPVESHADRLGYVIASGKTTEEALEAIRRAQSMVRISVRS